MGLRAGIDLGTTNSCIYVLVGNERVVVRDNFQRPTFPSAVWKRAGKLEIGYKARGRLGHIPKPIIEIKRLMGTDGTVTLDGEAMTAPQVSALILRYLKELAEAYVQQYHAAFAAPVTDVVITHPAYFSAAAKADTAKAGAAAGFERVDLLAEPVAAALAYSARADAANPVPADQRFLVFDLGGGTFDVTLLERRVADGTPEVIEFGGDPFLGGCDFDACLAEHIRRHLVGRGYALRVIDPAVPEQDALLQKLKAAAEAIKIGLSGTEVYYEPKPGFGTDLQGQSFDLDIEIGRAEFNAMTQPLMDKAMRLTHRLLARQSLADGRRLTEAEVEALPEAVLLARSRANAAHCEVMLAGSSTWMPVVKERLTAELDRPCRIVAPDVIVAEGAAVRIGATEAPVQVGGERPGDPVLVFEHPRTTSRQRSVVIKGEVRFAPTGAVIVLDSHETGESKSHALGERPTFLFQTDLLRSQLNEFSLALDRDGTELLREKFTIVHDPTYVEPPPPRPENLSMPISVQTSERFVDLFPAGAQLPASSRIRLMTPDDSGRMRIPFYEGDEYQREIVVEGAPAHEDFVFDLSATIDRRYRIEADVSLPGANVRVEFAIKPRALRSEQAVQDEWEQLRMKLDDLLTDADPSKRLACRKRWHDVEADLDRALSARPADLAHAEAQVAKARKLVDEAAAVPVLKPPLEELEYTAEDLSSRVRSEPERRALADALERARKAWRESDASAYAECVKTLAHVKHANPRRPPPPEQLRASDLAAVADLRRALQEQGKLTGDSAAAIDEARRRLESSAADDSFYAVHNSFVVPLFQDRGAASGLNLPKPVPAA